MDHALIRDLLRELEALFSRAARGEHVLDEMACQRARDLRRLFVAHLALEDNHLVPLLRSADGAQRAEAARLAHEHALQREHLETLLRHLSEQRRPAPALVAELHELVLELLEGMRGEELAVQSEDFLGGEAVPVGIGGP